MRRSGPDAGNAFDSISQTLIERLGFRAAIADQARVEPHLEQVIAPESGTGAETLLKVAIDKRGDREQYDGHGHLPADQKPSTAPPAADAGTVVALSSPR